MELEKGKYFASVIETVCVLFKNKISEGST
jgi:hypothetical protein